MHYLQYRHMLVLIVLTEKSPLTNETDGSLDDFDGLLLLDFLGEEKFE